MAKYNQQAVQQAIDSDKSIGRKEAKAIHALCKARVTDKRTTTVVVDGTMWVAIPGDVIPTL